MAIRFPIRVRWRLLGSVLRDAWPFWLAIAGLLLAFGVGCLAAKLPADGIRYGGTILEVMGLGVVVHGLSDMRKLFGRPSLWKRISTWFTSLAGVFQKPRPITLQASAAGSATAAGDLTVVRGKNPNATLEDRIWVLEADVENLRQELQSQARALKQEAGRLGTALQRESQERKHTDEATARKIEEVAIGGIHLEFLGLFWLFTGLVASSLPFEIVTWLAAIF